MENVEGLDLQSDDGLLENYVKIRGNTLGKPVFYYMWVSVFAMVPGEKMQDHENGRVQCRKVRQKRSGKWRRLGNTLTRAGVLQGYKD